MESKLLYQIRLSIAFNKQVLPPERLFFYKIILGDIKMTLAQKRAISYAYLEKTRRKEEDFLTQNNLWDDFKKSKYKTRRGFINNYKKEHE